MLGTSRGDGGAMNVLQRVVDIFGMVRNKASIVTWAGSVLILQTHYRFDSVKTPSKNFVYYFQALYFRQMSTY